MGAQLLAVSTAVAFSSLADLFRGEDDCGPVHQPGLIVAICDSLANPPPSMFAVAEALYPDLLDVGPKTAEKYAAEIGDEALKGDPEGLRVVARAARSDGQGCLRVKKGSNESESA